MKKNEHNRIMGKISNTPYCWYQKDLSFTTIDLSQKNVDYAKQSHIYLYTRFGR